MKSAINLSTLNGNNGFIINGIDNGDALGNAVSNAGDVNNDGIADIIVGAIGADPNGNNFAGESYVIFGTNNGFNTSFDLLSLDGSNGFVINGIDGSDSSGFSVSDAGDVNGDGVDDVIIGAVNADPNGVDRAGESYVVFGSNTGFSPSLNLSSLNGSNGFVINGINASDSSSRPVSAAGDVNGDGFDDVVIGAFAADPNGNLSGQSYVVFGSGNPAASLDLSSLDGSNGFTINGINSSDRLGLSVSNAGDINGDGIGDILLGAFGANNEAGESYIIFGNTNGFAANFDLLSLDGSNGFVIPGVDSGDISGNAVSNAGDINDDGIDDIIIGAKRADTDSNFSAGESYVVFGSTSGFNSSLDLASLDGSNGFVINGIDGADQSGNAVSQAGDVNGDGIDDIIVAAYEADPNGNSDSGENYVVFGRSSGFTASFDLSDINGSNGFIIQGIDTDDNSGFSVSGAGDINNDGFDDVIIGTRFFAFSDSPGESYVLFGSNSFSPEAINDAVSTDENTVITGNVLDNDLDADGDTLTVIEVNGQTANIGSQITLTSGALLTLNTDGTFSYDPNGQFQSLEAGESDTDSFTYKMTDGTENDTATVTVTINSVDPLPPSVINLSDLDGSNGFVINGIDENDFSGGAVNTAGDINGDGFDDVIIGAVGAGYYGSGESYIIFGSDSEFDPTLELSSLDGSNGSLINGINSLDQIGNPVGSAGDVNGDGFDDAIIGSLGYGDTYVVFGSSNGLGASFDLSSLNGNNGFVIDEISRNRSIDSAGDVNGDGFDDIIIAPDGYGRYGSPSESYVVFGSSNGFSSRFDLSTLDGSNGFTISGIDAGNYSGDSVSSAGDINGDGFDDVIIGGVFGNNFAGVSYVIFGSGSGFAANLDISSLDGSNGFVIPGIDDSDFAGYSVSDAGDVNGDGLDDIIIGALRADPDGSRYATGESYVVFGNSNGFGASFNLNSLNGSNGFRIDGADQFNYAGSVSHAGDVNGDGFDDVLISGRGTQEGYVVFGSDSGFASSIDLADLDGTNGFIINPSNSSFLFSNLSFQGAGDVNGDGFDDVVVGNSSVNLDGNRYTGQSYVIFGFSTTNINSAPDAVNDSVNTDENTAINGDVLANDSDANNDPLIVTEVNGNAADVGSQITLNSGALLTLNADGTFDYDPNSQFESLNTGETATDNFTYKITDGTQSDIANVTVTIDGITDNTTPNAVDDTVNTDEDTAISGNVLTNDTDPNNDPLIVTEVNGISADVGSQITLNSGALLTLNANGTFDYDPNSQFESLNTGETATDSFIYTITDGSETDSAAVTINIDGITDSNFNIINGTSADDSLRGTNQADFITGNDGDDTLRGRGGDDIIEGGSGGDIISGNGGNDILAADELDRFDDIGATVSELQGGNGDDTLIGGNQPDLLRGGNHDDVLSGNAGNDTLRGGRGDDILNTDAGDDLLQGNGGTDTVVYQGVSSDFTFNGSANNFTVTSTTVNIGTDTLQSIEFLQFDDGLFTPTDFGL
ncbi:MAG: Ig-like domain-containing protein [Cyanobacteria bacterium J06592_8]